MKTIVIGAGEVGYHIAERLSREGHDVVVIEQASSVRARVQEELDVITIEGSGSSPRALEEAGVRDAELIIAVADIDEVNVTACLLAKEYGVPRRIARVWNPDFSESPFLERGRKLGIELLINPTIVVAEEILDLIKTPAAAEVGSSPMESHDARPPDRGRGTIWIVPLKLSAFHATTPSRWWPSSGRSHLLPMAKPRWKRATFVLHQRRESVNDILILLGKKESIIERILVIGGGRIGFQVAQRLEQDRYKVKLLELSQARCEELSRLLEHALVLRGDGTDVQTLLDESIADMDAVVTVTDDEATNILAALLAKEQGAKKVMALIKRPHLLHLLPHLGIDAAISPRILTANVILKYVRKGRVLSIFEMPESDAETLEMAVAPGSPIAGKAIRDAGLPPGVIVGAVVHGGEIVVPRGNTVLRPEDTVVVFALPKAIPDVERLFA
jgi:trk system potassium uptake protein TrkA